MNGQSNMLRGKNVTSRAIRWYSSGQSYEQKLHSAKENIYSLLEQQDRSSYVLSQYIPEPARNGFIAIRGFNLEVNKINDGGARSDSVASQASSQLSGSLGFSTVDFKFKFWSDLLARVFSDPYSDRDLGDPIAILLRDALRKDLNLDISYFHQFLQTRRHFLKSRTFQTVEDICSYGEGTYSQLNYATQALLLSPSISPSAINLLEESSQLQGYFSDISAHIGQATAVSSMILGLNYYATGRNQVTLPVNLMTKFQLPQESVLRLVQGHVTDPGEQEQIKDKLKNVVYETAITANDHILAAREKLETARQEIKKVVEKTQRNKLIQAHAKKWKRSIPDVLFAPSMLSIPTSLYLKKLEAYDFDVLNSRLQQKEWRLPWASLKSYYTRKI